MERNIVLRLFTNDLKSDINVSVQIGELEEVGLLEPYSGLIEEWKHLWERYSTLISPNSRIKNPTIIFGGSINQQPTPQEAKQWGSDCNNLADSLSKKMNDWLNAKSFDPVRNLIMKECKRTDQIRLHVRTQILELRELPWHTWDILNSYNFGVVYSPVRSSKPREVITQKQASKKKIKILVIKGDSSEGLKTEIDLQILSKIPPDIAEITYLVKDVTQTKINHHLCNYSYDFLYYAGHSESHEKTCRIWLNDRDWIDINSLKKAFEKAISNGLKLAFFNSCQGLNLAYGLEEFYIPNVIVMRESVPDEVAREYLSYFIQKIIEDGLPLHIAAQEAQNYLHGLQNDFPLASWLPVLCQSSSVEAHIKEDIKPNFQMLCIISLAVTSLVMGIRFIGKLKPLELYAYDYMMQRRPPMEIDPRIVVIEADDQDIEEYTKPGQLVLSDAIISQLIGELQKYKPSVIGLDIFRSEPKLGREQLISNFSKSKNLIAICAQTIEPPREFTADQLKMQVGFADLFADDYDDRNDKTIRRQILWKDGEGSDCPNSPYAFSTLLANQYLANEVGRYLDINKTGNMFLGNVEFQNLMSRTGGYQDLVKNSAQILLNFRPPNKDGQITKAYKFRDVLGHRIKPHEIANKVVIIGVTSSKLQFASDSHFTPYGAKRGLWVHTQMVSAILSSVIGDRSQLRVLPQLEESLGAFQWGDMLCVLVTSFAGSLFFIWVIPSRYQILTGSITVWMLYEICLFGLSSGYWLPFVPAAVALFTTMCFIQIYMRLQIKG